MWELRRLGRGLLRGYSYAIRCLDFSNRTHWKCALQYAGAVEQLVRSRKPIEIDSMSDMKSFVREVWGER